MNTLSERNEDENGIGRTHLAGERGEVGIKLRHNVIALPGRFGPEVKIQLDDGGEWTECDELDTGRGRNRATDESIETILRFSRFVDDLDCDILVPKRGLCLGMAG